MEDGSYLQISFLMTVFLVLTSAHRARGRRLEIVPSKRILVVEDVVQELTHFEVVNRPSV